MYSAVAITEEIDDLEEAISELKEQVSSMELKSNTVGISYIYYDVDIEEYTRLLKETFDFPVIGVTSMALLNKNGYLDYGIELLVLSADDVEFEVGITDVLNTENYSEKIGEVYSKMKESKNNQKEALIMTYLSKPIGHSTDDYVRAIDKISGGSPVYGGIASDMFTYVDTGVFCGDIVRSYAAVFLLMYGNVNPIAVAESSVSNEKYVCGTVTKSAGNTVYQLEDKPFVDVLEETGLLTPDEDKNVAMEFMQTPFVVNVPIDDNENVKVLRNLIHIHRENGSGEFLGNILEGSKIGVGSIGPTDIGKSVNQAFEKLLEKLNESKDYKYSTIIFISCTGRYINLVGDKNIEGNAYKDIIPDNLSVSGMYSYGELCPVKSQLSDKYYNMSHNETFTILAL